MSGTVAQIEQFFRSSGRDWNQMCQAVAWNLCHRFGAAPVAYPSAKAAYEASQIVSRDPRKAQAGDFHYWDIGSDGHVAADLGGGHVLMGSSHVDLLCGTNVGITTVDRYTRLTGARYLGFAHTNGRNDFVVAHPAARPSVIVQDGDTLSKIASAHGTTWQRLAQVNNLTDPDLIHPGQKIYLS